MDDAGLSPEQAGLCLAVSSRNSGESVTARCSFSFSFSFLFKPDALHMVVGCLFR